jgi:hypothetical protein
MCNPMVRRRHGLALVLSASSPEPRRLRVSRSHRTDALPSGPIGTIGAARLLNCYVFAAARACHRFNAARMGCSKYLSTINETIIVQTINAIPIHGVNCAERR